jgi:hypothetical protein
MDIYTDSDSDSDSDFGDFSIDEMIRQQRLIELEHYLFLFFQNYRWE